MNIALCNLGCTKNQVDGEHIAGWLAAAGHCIVDEYAQAETILVNTCAFIEEAKQEAINAIIELAQYKKTGACKLLIVCGCFAQRYRDQVAKQFPEVDHWIGVHGWREELERIFAPPAHSGHSRLLIGTGTVRHLKISEGCSRRCAFCAIPSIRGPMLSRTITEIIDEAKRLEEQGARECVLVSQDTSSWGRDLGSSLEALLDALLKNTSFPWLRLMYLYPAEVSDGLLGLMARETRICPYLDIPMQHASEHVLRRMRRAPGGAALREFVSRIRSQLPGVALRSTFIVGFPGESEADFEELLDFILWARLERAGVFAFSAEEGTEAYRMRPRPRNATVQRRCEQFMTVQRDISAETGHARIGSVLPVIIDIGADAEHPIAEGRTQWDAPEVDGVVQVRGAAVEPGSIVRVRITGADAYDLDGEIA